MTNETASALHLLGLVVPTTRNAIKVAYRRAANLEHPDRSRHPQAKERFHAVQAAYELLQKDTSVLDVVESLVTLTEEGDELAKLGKGLGPTTNGLSCEDCKGMGYVGYASQRTSCPNCRNAGFRTEYRCMKCSGTGSFRMRSGNVGQCFACKGSGWYIRRFERTFANSCPSCLGIGTVASKQVKSYHTCYKCKGKGELPMWNPVLPKGFLASLEVSR